MNGLLELTTSTGSSSSAAWSSQADCAIADYFRAIAGELVVMPAGRDRDAAGLDGRRPTELALDEAAA